MIRSVPKQQRRRPLRPPDGGHSGPPY